MLKKIKVMSLVDFLGIIGFVVAWPELAPKPFIVVCISLAIYYFVRFLAESKKILRIVYIIISLLCLGGAIIRFVDQSSIARIEVIVDEGKQYYTEDELIASDFSVYTVKKNNKKEIVDVFTFAPSTLQKGKNIIQVQYKNFEAAVVIEAIDPYIEYLEITAIKSNFYVGDHISKKDFNVIGVDSKGNRSIIDNYKIASDEILAKGDNTFIFTYETASGSITVSAKEHEIVTIEAEYVGNELLYEGDTVTPSDFKVIGVYDNGVRENLPEFSIDKSIMALGDNRITVTYGDLKTSLTLTAHGIINIEATINGYFFFAGEKIEKADLSVEAIYDNKERITIEDFEVEETELVEGDNDIHITYEKWDTVLTVNALKSLSSSVTMTGNMPQWDVSDWNVVEDFDISGRRHENGGKKITATDIWHQMDPNHAGSSAITMTIFIPLNPKSIQKDPSFVGVFVLDRCMKDKETKGTIEIKSGDKVLFSTGEIGGDCRKEYPFDLDLSNCDSIEIFVNCTVKNSPFVFGFLNQ